MAHTVGLPIKPTFFATAPDFRKWLEKHHGAGRELWVGFHKRGSGRPSITWPESVDQALCFGWIDGQRKSIDDTSYAIRFTPRRRGSTWSSVNVRRVEVLKDAGLMRPAGLRAFEQRREGKTAIYGYEQTKTARLDTAAMRTFRANKKAWRFFEGQAPSYRRAAVWWVISAKKEETRRRRLAVLIEDSEQGRTIPPLTRRTTRP